MHQPPQPPPKAVCIGITAEELAPELREALAPFECLHDRDVYRALARMATVQPALLVIEVGWLPGAAFEFFDIVAKRQPNVTMLVVGPPRADARIRDALAHGAHGRATPEAIRACLAGPPAPQPVHRSAVPGGGPRPERNKSDTFAPAGNVFDAELDRRLREQADAAMGASGSDEAAGTWEPEQEPAHVDGEVKADADAAMTAADAQNGLESTGRAAGVAHGMTEEELADIGARVPWMPYEDRPKRVPPRRMGPADQAAAGSTSQPVEPVQPASRLEQGPPLLSDEEIAALMQPIRRERRS